MRVAFVIPWFGPDLKGGAEQQAWQFATRLARRGNQVDVLTTCCRSFFDDWGQNHLAAGDEVMEGVTVRRFRVDARDHAAHDALNGVLLGIPKERLRPGIPPLPPEAGRPWTDHNINSTALEEWLAANEDRYDAIIFIPYLYGPTLRGLPRVAAKAWLQPCLHDECYAYLPDVVDAFYAARGLLFNSSGERETAVRLYGPRVWSRGVVIGEGIEFEPLEAHASAPLPEALGRSPFLLLLGRRDAGKGVVLACEAFRAFRARSGDRGLRLVLAGPGNTSYADEENGILDLGLVDEATRVALLRRCRALLLPSPNESFSRVLHEAWYCGRPAVVRESCDATRQAVVESGGGWRAESLEEWTQRIAALAVADPAELVAAGARGRDYALDIASWEAVLDRCERVFGPDRDPVLQRAPGDPQRIDQLSPGFAYGDAISNEMVEIRRMLREGGYQSDILVLHYDPAMASEVRRAEPGALSPAHGLIYHHSIGSEITPLARAHAGPKALVYHNITPPEHFRPFRPDFSRLLRDGREQMWELAGSFDVSVGDSAYNAAELARFGFPRPGVLPLPVDPATWNVAPTPAWMERLGDGRPNVLFVGRVAPNKRQDRLVEAFALLPESLGARLVIAGSCTPDDPFAHAMRGRIAELGLEDRVVISGHCALADLHAFYRTASLFWSFSEHEGFGVPLVEAMWFDVPVLAMAAAAVPETLGGAGETFPWTEEDYSVARRAAALIGDTPRRARLLETQRRRRDAFRGAASRAALAELVDRMRAAARATREIERA